MAQAITGTSTTEVYNVTLSATPGNVTTLTLPGKPGVLRLMARTTDAKMCATSALADNAAIAATAYHTLTAGAPEIVPVDGVGGGYIQLASATASQVVEVTWMAD
jgi:hypothetical protein